MDYGQPLLLISLRLRLCRAHPWPLDSTHLHNALTACPCLLPDLIGAQLALGLLSHPRWLEVWLSQPSAEGWHRQLEGAHTQTAR